MNHIALIGLGTMGANLARNAARNGATVSIYNRTTEKVDHFMEQFAGEGSFIPCKSIEELTGSFGSNTKAIILMVKAGEAVDEMIAQLVPHLSENDIIIDAGNSHYRDTERRVADLASGKRATSHEPRATIRYVGMGVSGGEEGALLGPSMMPGGDESAVTELMPLLTKMAAEDGMGGTCVTYIGPGGAGHFVKTVHNGIEYGVMQILAESYHLLLKLGSLSHEELAGLYKKWNETPELTSFLMEITAKIFTVKDGQKDLIDLIVDKAAQKGTGKWTTESAFDYGVSVPTITAGVDARIISSAKDFRVKQSAATPLCTEDVPVEKDELIEGVKSSTELSMLNAYAQGFQLIVEASKAEKWSLNVSEIARIWMGGCIIRSSMTDAYRKVFAGDREAGLALRARFNEERQKSWRNIVALGALRGIPLPAMSSALWYYDAYRIERLPQNLVQAQRDFFGAHGFERVDAEGPQHLAS